MTMKKLILISMALIALSSCVKHPVIYPKLSEEEAAAIPYQMGQTVKFLDQNGDILTFQVIRDETYLYNGEQYYNAIYGGDVMHPAPYPYSYYCYARTVVLACDQRGKQLCFTILPKKEFIFAFVSFGSDLELNGYLSANSSYVINNADYEEVYHEFLYNQETDELLYDWYYSEEFGLLSFTKGSFSLTWIP